MRRLFVYGTDALDTLGLGTKWRSKLKTRVPIDSALVFNESFNDLQPYGVNLGPTCFTTPVAVKVNRENIQVAVATRLIPDIPLADLAIFRLLAAFVRSYFSYAVDKDGLLIYRPLPLLELDDDYIETWLLKCDHYNENRKNQLRASWHTICDSSFVLDEKHFASKIFIKREFYEKYNCARCIVSRSDVFKVVVGYCISQIEERVYKDRHFVKGIDPRRLPSRLKKLEKFDFFCETDYSKFESSFSLPYQEACEIQLWRHMLVNNPFLLNVILRSYYQIRGGKQVQRTHFCRNQRFTLKLSGSRLSGEMWTSLGNGFSNLMNLLFLARQNKVHLKCFVEGDDGLFGCDSMKLQPSMFRQLGFNIKMIYGNDLSHTAFCGNIFHPETENVLVCPENIPRLFWSCSAQYICRRTDVLEKLLRAKAMSMYCIGKKTPIVSFLAWRIIKTIGFGEMLFDPNRRWWTRRLIDIIKTEKFTLPTISLLDRELYASKFGIPISDQLRLEQFILSQDTLDFEIPYEFGDCANVGSAY